MAHFGFLLPDDLREQFDLFAASRGGRSAALRMLVAQALEADGAAVTPPSMARRDQGGGESFTIRLSAEDLDRLDEECQSMGMSRGQWLQSCVRNRLRGSRHFGPVDRTRIAKIVSELRYIKTILFRCAGALERAPWEASVLDKHHVVIAALSSDVAHAIGKIEAALRGNDQYWRQEPVVCGLEDGQPPAEGDVAFVGRTQSRDTPTAILP